MSDVISEWIFGAGVWAGRFTEGRGKGGRTGEGAHPRPEFSTYVREQDKVTNADIEQRRTVLIHLKTDHRR